MQCARTADCPRGSKGNCGIVTLNCMGQKGAAAAQLRDSMDQGLTGSRRVNARRRRANVRRRRRPNARRRAKARRRRRGRRVNVRRRRTSTHRWPTRIPTPGPTRTPTPSKHGPFVLGEKKRLSMKRLNFSKASKPLPFLEDWPNSNFQHLTLACILWDLQHRFLGATL